MSEITNTGTDLFESIKKSFLVLLVTVQTGFVELRFDTIVEFVALWLVM